MKIIYTFDRSSLYHQAYDNFDATITDDDKGEIRNLKRIAKVFYNILKHTKEGE